MVEKVTEDLSNPDEVLTNDMNHHTKYTRSQFFVTVSFLVCVWVGLIPLLHIVVP